MKTLLHLSAAALLLAGLSAPVAAQDWWTGASWGIGVGAEDTDRLIGETSYRNFWLEGRSFRSDTYSLGLMAGWSVFSARAEGPISIGGVDVSGRQNRFVNAIPLMATAHGYLRRPSFTLFAGSGVGTYWAENRLEIGQTAIIDDNWHFGIAPNVGVSVPLGRQFDLILDARYNYAFEASDITHAYWTFSIGFGNGL